MKRLVILMVSVVLLFNSSIVEAQSKRSKTKSLTQQTKAAEKKLNFTIEGKILNSQDLKPCFEEDIYLQMLAEPKDDKMPVEIKNGKIIVNSEGLKATIKKDGSYSFSSDNLMPGTYLVTVNNITGNCMMSPNFNMINTIFLANYKSDMKLPNDRVKIEIKSDEKLPLKINLGDTLVVIPGSKLNK